ncbi:hypothetical protein ACHAWF_009856 [Thalassiosira exigua]
MSAAFAAENDCVAKFIRQDGTRFQGCDESSGWIWHAARVLAAHLQNVKGIRILELGSGTGFLALTLARRGATVVATDRRGAIPLLTRNVYGYLDRIDSNGVDVSVEELHWEEGRRVEGGFDMAIGSDLIYIRESCEFLLDTVILHDCSQFVLAYESRKEDEETTFLAMAVSKGFRFLPPRVVGVNDATGNQILLVDMTYIK